MFTDEVSQKGAKDMSQKNMEVMLSMEDKAEAEELTAFLQSVNITKQTLMDSTKIMLYRKEESTWIKRLRKL